MKRLFLLIPVLVFSLLANAKEIEIGSSTSNIIHYTIAASSTSDGDVIVLTDAGPYVNSKANSDDYTKISKNVTIKAASGIHPVIKFEVPILARDGKSGKFIGIKFDGSSLLYDRYIYIKDGDTNDNSLEFEDCEFYGSSKYIAQILSGTKAKNLVFRNCKFYNNTTNRGILIQGTIGHLGFYGCEFSGFVKDVINGYETTSHVDSCIVSDCYFHNHSRSSIYFKASSVEGQQTCDKLIVKNSTFANIEASGDYTSVIDIRPYGTSTTSAIKVEVDHCTFYNNTVKNSDHANIRTAYLSDVTISNCIFAYPSAYATRATYCTGGGNINNCLTYNYTADGTKGHAYGCTVNAASSVGNPLFNDLANNKYTYAGNWVTMNISPARGTATDGSDLGDPRWYSAEVLPEVDFASPYQFIGPKALLAGQIGLNGNDHIEYYDTNDKGTATWKIHATRACVLNATLNMEAGSSSGHIFKVVVMDADGNTVGEMAEPSQSSHDGNIDLPGTLTIPAEGDYTVILYNLQSWSQAKLEGVTFTYVGGDVQTMPGTTDIDDAWFSSNATRADGKITLPSGKHDLGWVKWNVAFASAGNYNVTVNVNNTDGHNFTVALYRSESDESPISVGEGGSQYSSGSPNAIALGAMEVPAGNYIMKVTDAIAWSNAELLSVTIAYAGGAVVNIPNNNIPLTEAILADGATRDGDGLHFKNAQYVKWNIHATEGLYTFTAHCTSPSTENYSNLMITVKQGNTELYSYAPQYYYNQADKEIQSPAWLLDAGDYTLELSNPTSGNGYLTSLAATAPSNMFILDDNKTDDGSIAAAAEAGTSYKFLLKRSFTAGRYYTICIPVGSWNDELKLAFGADYELWKMTSAEQNGDAIDLNFDQINGQSFHAGWPYIIKPSVDVQNPVLYNEKTITNSTYNNTQSFTAADFIGTFYKSEIPAGENNLYLQNNNLYYSESSNTTIKGTRAWIRLKQQQGSAPARARIVMGGQVATDINLVNGELINGTVKTIENGQLILIRDGKKYNVMGTRLQ